VKRCFKIQSKPSDLPYFSYKLFGKRLEFFYPLCQGLKNDLAKADMKIGIRPYICQSFFISILATASCFGVFLILNIATPTLLWMIFPPLWAPLLTLFVIPIGAGAGAFLIQYSIPAIKARGRKSRMETLLPATTSYMSILASAGVDPEKIIRSVAAADDKMVLSKDVRSTVVRIDLLGFNILTALEEEARRSPSVLYANLLKGLAYTLRTGGSMKRYLLEITTQLLNRREQLIQQFLTTLDLLAETFVLMFTAFPLLIIIMLSLMASVGGTLGGLDLIQLMYMLTFIIIPIMASCYILLIDILQPRG